MLDTSVGLPKSFRVFSEEDLQKIEVTTSNVSAKYMPIKTSKFLKNIKMEFVNGVRKGSQQIVVGKADSLNCIIENSFDGSLAFRTSFSDGNLTFGFIRQIHMGKNAKSIENMSKEFVKTIHDAKKVLPRLQVMELPESTKAELFSTAMKCRNFNHKRNTLVTKYTNYSSNAYTFLVDLFKDLKEGAFLYKNARGTIRKGRKIRNEFRNLEMQKRIWDKLKEIHIEMYF